MYSARSFKLPTIMGMQTIRLDQDSLDYDWNGLGQKFHGTLPYENVRMNGRVTRRDQRFGLAALFVGLIFLSLSRLFPPSLAPFFDQWLGMGFAMAVGGFIVQVVSGGVICMQIDSPPFGFTNSLSIPDTKAGRAFLVQLQNAWKDSLKRRFLDRGVEPELLLRRIGWLEVIGALTGEEATAERSQINRDEGIKPEAVSDFALN